MTSLMSNSRFLTKAFVVAALALAFCLAPASIANAQTPTALHMVSIGVSQHQNPQVINNLKSAAKDAQDMAQLFRGQQGKLFSQVNVTTLTDQHATAGNIRSALSSLRSKANAGSYVIVYLAGHGTNKVSGEYEFTAHDYHPHRRNETTISWNELRSSLNGLPGRVILILDSCHSGAVSNGGNMIVFSASLANQVSKETPQNGYFTKALIEALSGKADMNKDGMITLAEVDAYVSGQVEMTSGGLQQTTVLRPSNVRSSLPLARLTLGNFHVVNHNGTTSNFTSSGPITSNQGTTSGPINNFSTSGPITSSGPVSTSTTTPSFSTSGPLSGN